MLAEPVSRRQAPPENAASRPAVALFAALAACSGDPSPSPSASASTAEDLPSASVAPTAAPSASVTLSAAASAAAPVPSGARRGLWIWELGKNAPPAARSAELAASWGVHRVFLKGSNGNVGPRWWKNASPENIAEFTSRGIEVWVFGYFYAEDSPDAEGRTWGTLSEQVASILKVALAPGVRGVVVDAEQEFKGRPKDAVALCRLLRAKLGERALAYTSYGWIAPNKTFPFAEFDRHCGDAFLPQIYWAFGWPGDVSGSIARLEKEVKALGLRAPLWPVQSNEKDPPTAKLSEFFERTGPDASIFYLHPDGSPQSAKLGELEFR